MPGAISRACTPSGGLLQVGQNFASNNNEFNPRSRGLQKGLTPLLNSFIFYFWNGCTLGCSFVLPFGGPSSFLKWSGLGFWFFGNICKFHNLGDSDVFQQGIFKNVKHLEIYKIRKKKKGEHFQKIKTSPGRIVDPATTGADWSGLKAVRSRVEAGLNPAEAELKRAWSQAEAGETPGMPWQDAMPRRES